MYICVSISCARSFKGALHVSLPHTRLDEVLLYRLFVHNPQEAAVARTHDSPANMSRLNPRQPRASAVSS